MLGVTENPVETVADRLLRSVAADLGAEHTYRRTPVGVLFGSSPADVPDPFFGGAGPTRRTCTLCGSCLTGCRRGAKNTLVKNYLYLAEAAGAVVHPLTTVRSVRPLPGGGYAVDTRAFQGSGSGGRPVSLATSSWSCRSSSTPSRWARSRERAWAMPLAGVIPARTADANERIALAPGEAHVVTSGSTALTVYKRASQ
jgi:ferredoxin